jgi:exodeoxyribonuclease VII large subunit
VSTPDQAWSVAELARMLKGRVESGFVPVWVRGELVGVKRYPSGHWYFGLRDPVAKVDCTMWKGAAQRLRLPLEEGTEIFALGTANVWEERTALRFNVTQVLPTSAVGATAQQVERTRQKLLADGLLDPARKRPLPAFPRRIAVITSLAGAAVRDVITVAARRWPGIELLVVGAAVQGEQAAGELVAALTTVNALEAVDLCIIGRGGGAREDLAAFNDELLCRAIAACRVPVISAVGHEVDITLADLVADLRAATPSQAAEFALPDRLDVLQRVGALHDRLLAATDTLLVRRTERLERTRDRLGNALLRQLRGSERRVAHAAAALPAALERTLRVPRERLARASARLEPAMLGHLVAGRGTLDRLAAALDALSPLAVLARGYAVPRDSRGRLLRTVSEFVAGEPFTLRVTDGEVRARTERHE